ncbi:uncharacterized protein CIMG_04877 [Coccidioides immitis RS]|uniref:Uncharacterized protein n=1 Tax=Coccidioides immitis (strain RS) TaxID=246410 RepID=J3KEE8_COCIM|nr:uncharacterized protein CIMG_04877 [Coccidioides immitis RS]EAS33853.3 hypothetical protein CIMG_04877 [Coccidioides immitis RS]
MSGKTASLGHSEFRRDAPVVMTGSKAKESASKFPNNDTCSVRFDRPGLDRGPLGTFMMGSRCSSSPRSTTPTGEKPCGFGPMTGSGTRAGTQSMAKSQGKPGLKGVKSKETRFTIRWKVDASHSVLLSQRSPREDAPNFTVFIHRAQLELPLAGDASPPQSSWQAGVTPHDRSE